MNAKRVVVVGAGMAGLVAALQAQGLGAEVTLLEKGAEPGGSLAMSGGTLWCARTHEDLRRLVPRGDAELGRVLVEDYPGGIEWLKTQGATVTLSPSLPDRWVYFLLPKPTVFVAQMIERFTGQGGTLCTETAGTRIEIGPSGEVRGVAARTPTGQRTFEADAVVLTTGGFQANAEMRARYFGPLADRIIVRSNPRSTGDGFRMGTDVDAAASGAMSSFYGHLLPAPPAKVPTNDFVAYTQYHSDQGILVNARGERFTDESLGDETNAQAVARQPDAIAYFIYDDDVYREFGKRPGGPGSRPSDSFFESQALGAPAAVVGSMAELEAAIDALGGPGAAARATLEEYNAAVEAGRAANLRVARRAKARLLTRPPFYVLGVTPGITFTLGGLRINANAQALDRAGWPIAGLYAAGADAGGIHNEQYAGGLCLGLVFGRRAARHAMGDL